VAGSDGREFPVETTIGLAGARQHAFFTAFLHDISDRKQVERMKSEFISTVSHELRTPITAIRISLGMLADGSIEDFSPDVKKLIDIAYESCERLVRMINDILDIEKIESGRMQYQLKPQKLVPVVEAAVASTAAYAAPFIVGIAFDSDDSDPTVAIDHDRMTQVMVNLLSNAVKFSPQGQQVLVRIKTQDGKARIAVTDHGPGIPAEFQDRIFQKFAQADGSNTRTREGTGLGLSICQQLVIGHGGAISFETAAGQGTTFFVDLPLA
jgi:signal transduction histidine kinase